MEKFNKLLCAVSIELKGTAEQTEKEMMTLFPSLFTYDLLTGQKHDISYNFDPPWDHSGQLFRQSSDAHFNMDQYKKVGDFFEEYTGNSRASYVSGCGLFHETYGEKYEEWMEEQFRKAHYSVLQSLDDEVLSTLESQAFGEDDIYRDDRDLLIDDLQDTFEELEDFSFLSAENLRMKLSEMDIRLAYKLGEKQAKERIHKEKVAMEQRLKQIEREKAAFTKLWTILEQEYKLAYQKPFPKRIDMSEYASFKKFLDDHNVKKRERILIGNYAPISFSNSVSFKLLR